MSDRANEFAEMLINERVVNADKDSMEKESEG